MSIVAGVLAGGSFLGSKRADKKASEADREADIMAEYQGEINAQQALSDASVNAYNMTRDFGRQSSGNQAMAGAMNKSATGGSAQAIQAEGQRTLDRDVERGYETAEMIAEGERLGVTARRSATDSRANARRSGTNTRGLLLASRML